MLFSLLKEIVFKIVHLFVYCSYLKVIFFRKKNKSIMYLNFDCYSPYKYNFVVVVVFLVRLHGVPCF